MEYLFAVAECHPPRIFYLCNFLTLNKLQITVRGGAAVKLANVQTAPIPIKTLHLLLCGAQSGILRTRE